MFSSICPSVKKKENAQHIHVSTCTYDYMDTYPLPCTNTICIHTHTCTYTHMYMRSKTHAHTHTHRGISLKGVVCSHASYLVYVLLLSLFLLCSIDCTKKLNTFFNQKGWGWGCGGGTRRFVKGEGRCQLGGGGIIVRILMCCGSSTNRNLFHEDGKKMHSTCAVFVCLFFLF